jgi:hypothetical protein
VNDWVQTFFGENRNQGGFNDPCVAQTHICNFSGRKGTQAGLK